MIEVLAVCTGNICRSPLAELVLRAGLDPAAVTVRSVGTRAEPGQVISAETLTLVENRYGRGSVQVDQARAHRARLLQDSDVQRADLVLAMARDHRRRAAELAPNRLRSIFTVREFGRLAEGLSTATVLAALAGSADPAERSRRALALVAGMRGEIEPPDSAEDDDVVDPYGRARSVYQESAGQLLPALEHVVRVVSAIAVPTEGDHHR